MSPPPATVQVHYAEVNPVFRKAAPPKEGMLPDNKAVLNSFDSVERYRRHVLQTVAFVFGGGLDFRIMEI
jgi:hypothetical protein